MTEKLIIKPDDVRSEDVIRLMKSHLALMQFLSPPESIHALDLDGLQRPEITFWRAEIHGKLVGCGALKELDDVSGEIKSMHTAPPHRGKGVGTALLRHAIAAARKRRYQNLYLETGSQPGFEPARALYARHGFVEYRPFATYVEDPNSYFMRLKL